MILQLARFIRVLHVLLWQAGRMDNVVRHFEESGLHFYAYNTSS
jgi:hypothetical protein